jgi:hypothetical protein
MAAHADRTFVKAEHRDGVIEIPVAVLHGARDGPTLAVITGMHGESTQVRSPQCGSSRSAIRSKLRVD